MILTKNQGKNCGFSTKWRGCFGKFLKEIGFILSRTVFAGKILFHKQVQSVSAGEGEVHFKAHQIGLHPVPGGIGWQRDSYIFLFESGIQVG